MRDSDKYNIEYSFSFSITTDPGYTICLVDVAYLNSTGPAFCSSYITIFHLLHDSRYFDATCVKSLHYHHCPTADIAADIITSVANEAISAPPKRVVGAGAAIATPASITSGSPSRISAACLLVATGISTVTTTNTASIPRTIYVEIDFSTVC
ncbi:hypothetical protein K432DRAFT_421406 [Lepidopterella palustris CBS 459.81]|uniref:Uncharacterized protein n=1 Tax=Lepidopterella palustris CBS 459.81 TaxID=1314670 RepID=A0A8E2ELG5_9PEZI|nr:hypothetical protein K432DRAFT_421406 [Lepidopterella palustris CBS 459.81]